MTTTMTLSALMSAVRQRADMLPAGYAASLSGTNYFVTDVELISYINQSYFALYDLLTATYTDYNLGTPQSITTDGVNTLFALAADFYKLRGVDIQVASGKYVPLEPFEFRERNRFSGVGVQTNGRTNLRYRVAGDKLWLMPLAASGQVLQLWYTPRMVQLAALSDTVDGISGWTEYIIVDAAIKCLAKEESDVSVLMAEKSELIRRIEAMAQNRDAGAPPKVTDATSGGGGPDGWDPGWGTF